MPEAYVIGALRTAGARRGGALAGWHPADMAGDVLAALVARTSVDPDAIDDVIMGCVNQAGEQANQIGRMAVLASGLPQGVPAVTIDRQCGSSQQALQFAAQAVLSGTQDVVIAAGVESMTRSPMFSNFTLHEQAGIGEGPFSGRVQRRFGVPGFSQFTGAEMMVAKYGFARDDLDRFALESHQKAHAATESGAFVQEIVALESADGPHSRDEGIRVEASLEAIAAVKPLNEGGTIAAPHASQICDGASAVLIVSARAVRDHGLQPIARIDSFAVTAGDPVLMLDEPIAATRRLIERCGRSLGDIDLFEVNEAFAPVPLAWLRAMDADPARLNVNGGSIALGHPLGATGTKLMATLIHALRARGKRYGLQTMCEAGGIANAMIVEAL